MLVASMELITFTLSVRLDSSSIPVARLPEPTVFSTTSALRCIAAPTVRSPTEVASIGAVAATAIRVVTSAAALDTDALLPTNLMAVVSPATVDDAAFTVEASFIADVTCPALLDIDPVLPVRNTPIVRLATAELTELEVPDTVILVLRFATALAVLTTAPLTMIFVASSDDTMLNTSVLLDAS
jgi:hypothetical protein